MKKLFIVCVITWGVSSGLFSQTIPFEKFDENKIDIGMLYTYKYSENKESFEPNHIKYLYIKTLKDIELMYIMADTLELPDIHTYVLNFNYMMLEKSGFSYAGDKNNIPSGYISERRTSIDFSKKIFKSNSIGGGQDGFKTYSDMEEFDFIPTYFYQITDLMPLWFALRFYPLGEKSIIVNSLTSGYNVELEIKYDGIEEVEVPFGKIKCHKFELIHQLNFFMKLFRSPKKAVIWLASEDDINYMVRYRNDNEQYSVIQNMEYRLAERKKITLKAWEELKTKNITQRLNAKKQ